MGIFIAALFGAAVGYLIATATAPSILFAIACASFAGAVFTSTIFIFLGKADGPTP